MHINIELDRQSKVPLYLQISSQIIDRINSGVLKTGTRLPAERKMAALLEVNRSTVVNAYSELEAGGYVSSHVGRGTEVAGKQCGDSAEMFCWTEILSGQGESMLNPYSIAMSELLRQRDLILMDSGIADPVLYPGKDFGAICKEILSADETILQHNCPQGVKSFRQSLVSLMKMRGLHTSPENIIVLNGSQQGIDLIGRLLLEPGDAVITEQPAFLGAIDVFRAYGVKLIGIPVDGEGMIIERLERVLSRVRPKLIYTIPTFQNPTGVTMSVPRRKQLVDLATRHHIPILEDDAYGLMYYGSPPPPPLASMDTSGVVIYLSTLSKILCPGLRLGWMAVPPDLARLVSAAKQLSDLHTNNLMQRMTDLYIRRGLFEKHLAKVKKNYIIKRDTMLGALDEFAPRGVSWNRPDGGFYIWASLPEGLSAVGLLQEAVKRKVSFVAGPVFFPNGEGANKLRLNFTYAQPGSIREGIKTLCGVIRDMQAGSRDKGIYPGRELIPIV
ncbi:MAG: PLP-dependent aminotransferase family protein [Bacillota bacterium]